MRARTGFGRWAVAVTNCAAAVAGTFGAGSALAQTWTDSPPWHSQARAMTIQIAPSGAAALPASTPHTSSPKAAAPGGPLSPSAAQPRAQVPSTSAWSAETKPKPVGMDTSTRGSSPPAGRRVVPFAASYPAGSIVVVNRERALYHVGPDGKAVRYPVAIGHFTEEWTGVEFVTDKKVNPTWHPVPEPGKEHREPVQGGDPTNPLGVRALYLGRTLWRIHGTPAADSIGQAVSSGCIRMHNDHVVELFDKVMLGTEVYVVDKLADIAPGHRGKKVIE